ncbi:Ig-like domain repeat protein [Cellulomonas sp. HZM]|uniref:Ig-like domain repeat protein n=1 Tax=Cellulomonas sp. HZM TaxID=1454010 RepID=UPI000493A765|nr:Ig-like domain repeat protein [Cellulomonas sp. HZM]
MRTSVQALRAVVVVTAAALVGIGLAEPASAEPTYVLVGHIARDAGVTSPATVCWGLPDEPNGEGCVGFDIGDDYELPALPAGRYRVMAWTDDGSALDARTLVTAGPTSTTVPTLRLGVGDPITGTLLDWYGRPAVGRTMSSSAERPGGGSEWQYATTDAHGHFSLAARPGLRYQVGTSTTTIDPDVPAGARLTYRETRMVPTTVRATAARGTYGTVTRVAAKVTADVHGGPTVHGYVSAYDGKRRVGSGAVGSGGRATVRVSGALTPGSHRLRLEYGGDANGEPSSTHVVVRIAKAEPTAKVTASAVRRGARAHVVVTLDAPTAVRGDVAVYVGGHRVGTGHLHASDGVSRSSVVTSRLTRTGKVTVQYLGSATMRATTYTTRYQVR